MVHIKPKYKQDVKAQSSLGNAPCISPPVFATRE